MNAGRDGSLSPTSLASPNGPGDCAPDSCSVALILLDLINTFDFPGSEDLLRRALPMADRLASLKKRCRALKIPVIYVNDHFGRWRSDFSALVEHCRRPEFRGREVVEKLSPDDDDYFVFKPMHSGFYQTTLELLLWHLGARRLILTGLASNICVLATANDAHMRGYRLWLPPDGMAATTEEEQSYAALHFSRVLSADTSLTEEIDLPYLVRAGESR